MNDDIEELDILGFGTFSYQYVMCGRLLDICRWSTYGRANGRCKRCYPIGTTFIRKPQFSLRRRNVMFLPSPENPGPPLRGGGSRRRRRAVAVAMRQPAGFRRVLAPIRSANLEYLRENPGAAFTKAI